MRIGLLGAHRLRRKGTRGPLRLARGLALHRAGGGFTAAAEAVLRHGGALALDDPGERT